MPAIFFAIHSDGRPWEDGSDSNGSVANMWRTGGDLYASSYKMWLDRLDLATDSRMRPFVGPGAFANPDFLEVGCVNFLSSPFVSSLAPDQP